jgi:coniferyl-aldehyde dehydrogenase
MMPGSNSITDMVAALSAQRAAFGSDPFPPLAKRRANLSLLEQLIEDHECELIAAVSADFGYRPAQETKIAELFLVRAEIRHARHSLAAWMRRKRVRTGLHFAPSRGAIMRQPLGVVGIVSPWNYPIQLALAPMVAALAAGNRVMLKPSEMTPKTSSLLARLLRQTFKPDLVAVIEGGREVAASFAALQFDHLFFTGSTRVGKNVAVAAAQNLVPVTLELGGKSPVIIDESASIELAAQRIAHGKLLNAGQTCVAPDYVLVPDVALQAFIDAYGVAARALYPASYDNADYCSLANSQQQKRLESLIDDARMRGAVIVPTAKPGAFGKGRLSPVLIINPPESADVMTTEIFGPILPVIGYPAGADPIAYVNARPRPLALYWFGTNKTRQTDVLKYTHAGGVTINGTIWHMAQTNLPFGGVGTSGSGSYHGEAGFVRFSHEKSVFVEHRLSGTPLLRPPFRKMFNLTLKVLRALT